MEINKKPVIYISRVSNKAKTGTYIGLFCDLGYRTALLSCDKATISEVLDKPISALESIKEDEKIKLN